MKKAPEREHRGAYSLVELLIVVAVIAIIATIGVMYVAGARETAHRVIARQQQAEIQTALGNWLVAKSSAPGGLAAAREAYTGTKLALLQNYLQAATYSSLTGSGDRVTSVALENANAYLLFSAWSAGQQPTVQWINQ